MIADLPEPSEEAREASAALAALIADEIKTHGWISFARYMELALYTPGLGYYAGGAHKFGDHASGGDFLTAPELTPLFGQALARQVAQVLAASQPCMIEAGAGSGRLAADLLLALDALGCAPQRYAILELSGELRARQAAIIAQHAPQFLDRVQWLDALPEKFSGCLIGNEVLDAMPTHAVRWDENGLIECGVRCGEEQEGHPLHFAERPASQALIDAAEILPAAAPYRGEISLAVRAWVAELAGRIECGAMILLDYGLPRRELYHPQRDGGTVRCHYRHRVHDDPFWYPGLSDITSHVDFTAVAEAGFDAGLSVLGYTNQAQFLINCGIGELLQEKLGADKAPALQGGRAKNALLAVADGDTVTEANLRAGLRTNGAVSVLLSPNEMGELFKVIALGRGMPQPLLGFTRGDRVHAL
ncbi:class I SAM-dependent methyltransferase [Rugosibacter aromaticivorans]|uniref:class I SAM-dependent methyltransferase n=1 Tax=Rugosibacter aromaticivorans TaxID=1565605 RepID=UPI000AF1CE7F|nr:SAM-dependent methyltransferase [Rugosibacter aromaticivorans]